MLTCRCARALVTLHLHWFFAGSRFWVVQLPVGFQFTGSHRLHCAVPVVTTVTVHCYNCILPLRSSGCTTPHALPLYRCRLFGSRCTHAPRYVRGSHSSPPATLHRFTRIFTHICPVYYGSTPYPGCYWFIFPTFCTVTPFTYTLPAYTCNFTVTVTILHGYGSRGCGYAPRVYRTRCTVCCYTALRLVGATVHGRSYLRCTFCTTCRTPLVLVLDSVTFITTLLRGLLVTRLRLRADTPARLRLLRFMPHTRLFRGWLPVPPLRVTTCLISVGYPTVHGYRFFICSSYTVGLHGLRFCATHGCYTPHLPAHCLHAVIHTPAVLPFSPFTTCRAPVYGLPLRVYHRWLRYAFRGLLVAHGSRFTFTGWLVTGATGSRTHTRLFAGLRLHITCRAAFTRGLPALRAVAGCASTRAGSRYGCACHTIHRTFTLRCHGWVTCRLQFTCGYTARFTLQFFTPHTPGCTPRYTPWITALVLPVRSVRFVGCRMPFCLVTVTRVTTPYSFTPHYRLGCVYHTSGYLRLPATRTPCYGSPLPFAHCRLDVLTVTDSRYARCVTTFCALIRVPHLFAVTHTPRLYDHIAVTTFPRLPPTYLLVGSVRCGLLPFYTRFCCWFLRVTPHTRVHYRLVAFVCVCGCYPHTVHAVT